MAVLFTQPEKQYPAQDNTAAVSVPADAQRIRISLDHPDWPDGECLRLFITWADGSTGEFSSGGGVVRDKAGNPTGGNQTLGWECAKPVGVTDCVAHVVVVQSLRTAVLIEAI